MKTKLLYVLLLVTAYTYSQISTTDLVREYLFANGSLANGINPGTNDLVATGTSQVLIDDAINQANNAIDINTNTYVSNQRGSRFDVSVSFWVKTATVDATVRPIIEQYGPGGFGPYGWKVQLVDGKIRLRSKFTNGGTDFKEVIIESSVIADNTWHHIAFTAEIQHNPGFVSYGYLNKLYVDGVEEVTGVDYTNGANTFLNSTTTNTTLAHNITLSNVTDGFTDGLDNIRIYNRSLTAAEVNELYKEHFGNLNRFYVNQNATGTGFGDTWTNAFTDLNKALTVASGQEIWVVQGVYTPDVSDRSETFNVSEDVRLYGGFVGNETTLQNRDFINNVTTLSGDLLGNDTATLSINEPTRLDNSHRVVTITGDNTLVDGFTITSGHFDTTTTARGAGVLKDNSVNTLELQNNIIINNVAQFDAAISALFPDVGTGKTAIIDNCTISNNLSKGRTAFNIGFNFTSGASGVLDATITDCLIENNFASDINGNQGVSASAGYFGSFSTASKVLNANVINCTITNNTDNGTDSSITNPGLIYGGGNVNFNLYNTIVWNNSITRTYTRNPYSTAFLACQNTLEFRNNITADDLSTICNGAILANNTNVDPLFTNSVNDFSLQLGSPAIDTGDNTFVNSTEDVLQNDRIYNGTVDIGAYESTFGPNNYSLTLNVVGSGTLSQTSGMFAPNTPLSITATPDFGSTFVGWTGDVTSTDATISVLMDSNKVITATFESPLFVDANATGNNDGSSWTDAYTDLHDALQNAVAGDQIWIAGGTYKPSTFARNLYYVIDKEDLKIYGGFAGTEVQLADRVLGTNETILSGDVQGNDANVTDYLSNYSNTSRNADNTYRIINILATGNNLLLDGLTISDAHNNANSTSRGAAIFKEKTISDLTLKNCILKDNVARNDNAALVAEFELNNTSGDRGNLIIENCQFVNNMSRWATSIYVFLRANTNVDVTVANTLFNGNLAGDLTPTITGISGSASWYRVIGDNSDMNLQLFNNTYVNNIDLGTAQSMTATNRAVVGVSKTTGTNRTLTATVANSIFWGNTTDTGLTTRSITDLYREPVTVNVYNSIDEANFNDSSITSTTNINNADPQFENALTDDYSLTLNSPAIDTGDNSFVFGSTDILGNQRIFNSIVDMGAYESDVMPPCIINIPDATFKSILVGNSTINTNGDAEIQCSEANAYTGSIVINGYSNPVSDITGIEAFVNLTELTAFGNSNLTNVDISSNTALTYLSLSNNALSSIDVLSNTALETLELVDNMLTAIDVSANSQLIALRVGDNQITAIDVTANLSLLALEANNNQISNLNISTNTNLLDLYLQNNSLISLDVSDNTSLKYLDVSNNSLSSLNVANGNNANFYDASNGGGSGNPAMDARGNANLSCIQHDPSFTPPNTGPTSSWRWEKDSSASYSINCASLGVSDYELNTMSIYPNPVSNTLNIKLKNILDYVEVYNLQGQKIMNSRNSKLDVSMLPQGVFVIKVFDESNKVFVKQFIKK